MNETSTRDLVFFTDKELHSSGVDKIREWAEAAYMSLSLQLESDIDEQRTAKLRGRIFQIKELLKLISGED